VARRAQARRRAGGVQLRTGGRYSIAERVEATPYGGVALALRAAQSAGLPRAINKRVRVLKQHQPYMESDHVLNIALNALCGGTSLQDIEHRRNDAAYLEMLGASAIPDPTTAGDFCRRFCASDLDALQDAINEARLKVWKTRGPSFTEKTAVLDIDSTIVKTTGERKQGMELTYKGVWGYHPLLVSYANTNEPLFILNRPGARPSVEGAPTLLDRAIEVCRRAGHTDILMRGDTAFTMTRHLDKWDQAGVRFVFGMMANRAMTGRAKGIENRVYAEFKREADKVFAARKPRAKQPAVKQQFVEAKGYKDLRLVREELAEFEHTPQRAKHSYRVVVLRKTVAEHRGQLCLGNAQRYLFYITNDRKMTTAQVVQQSNLRCAQEKLIGELKSGVHALRAPLNTTDSNAAFMIAASLAWSLKTWLAMLTPVSPRWRKKHSSERSRLLTMSFRAFVQELMLLPLQVARSGRKRVLRILCWRPSLSVFFRLARALAMA
jgi:hypothetical protein